MIKRVVVTAGLKARGYVDGRYVGEEKRDNERTDVLGRGSKRRGKAGASTGAGGKGRGKKRGANAVGLPADNLGNTVGGKRGRRGQGQGQGLGRGQGQPGQRQGQGQGRGRRGAATQVDGAISGNTMGPPAGGRGQPRGQPRKARSGKKTPFRPPTTNLHGLASPSEAAQMRRLGEEAKSGQFAEALAAQANVKRERLHKVMAQSGIGSRRDMEIMISSGRVMVNGIVATTGTQVSPGDNVMVDHRPVKLKFSEDLPRVLLYHKPEGEIVTTDDPGNRITVFDNLPRVENGKWIAIGRLDINTSGLLIFTTSGELANRFMHPRYEVEREYAVRILGELNEEQTQALLSGVNIDFDRAEDEEDDRASAPARFDTIEKRGGEGVNQWYHVTIKEGRNREVRKMFESQGLTVSRLIRIRFGKIELPQRLVRGKMVELSPEQVRSVLVAAGMGDEFGASGPRAPLPSRQRESGERPPGQGRHGQGQGKPRRGPPPKRLAEDGNAIAVEAGEGDAALVEGQEPASEKAPRARRSRRGGKGRRQGSNGAGQQMPGANDNAGNVAESGRNSGSSAGESGGNMVEGNSAAQPSKVPGARGNRNRQRRNFRGRGGRNRGREGADNAGNSAGNEVGNGGESNNGNTGGNTGGGGGNEGNGGDREGNF